MPSGEPLLLSEPAMPPNLTIWLDADAAPRALKDVCYQVAERRSLRVIVVANQHLRLPPLPEISQVKVGSGFDAADDHIADNCAPGDLVVTADVPLASRVVAKGSLAIDHRGRVLDEENVQNNLAMRDLSHELREEGLVTGGPPPFSKADRQRFINALDRTVTALLKD